MAEFDPPRSILSDPEPEPDAGGPTWAGCLLGAGICIAGSIGMQILGQILMVLARSMGRANFFLFGPAAGLLMGGGVLLPLVLLPIAASLMKRSGKRGLARGLWISLCVYVGLWILLFGAIAVLCSGMKL